MFSRSSIPRTGAVEVTAGHPYGSGYSDAELHRTADAEADAGVYTAAWGENRRPYPMLEVVDSAATNRSLLGHQLFAQLALLERSLALLHAGVGRLQAQVITAIGAYEQAQWWVLELERALEKQGLTLPDRDPFRVVVSVLLLVGLGFGELFLLSPAFQILGLSDRPLVGVLPFTAQHLAALSGVVALLVLAHALAGPRSEEAPDDRAARSGSWYDELSERSAGHRISMLGVVALLLGLAAVREVYLDATGQGNAWAAAAFVLLNLGVVVAARWASRPDQRPTPRAGSRPPTASTGPRSSSTRCRGPTRARSGSSTPRSSSATPCSTSTDRRSRRPAATPTARSPCSPAAPASRSTSR